MSAKPRPSDAAAKLDVDSGPGHILRHAREQASYSINEIAGRLHLDLRTVELLEADDFDALPAPTFVRGYLRAYARLLDLPGEPIVEAFDRRGLSPPALVADIARRPQTHSGDFPVRIFTYLVAAGLVALIVLWWHSQQSNLAPEAEDFVAAGEDTARASQSEQGEPSDSGEATSTSPGASTAAGQPRAAGVSGLDSALSTPREHTRHALPNAAAGATALDAQAANANGTATVVEGFIEEEGSALIETTDGESLSLAVTAESMAGVDGEDLGATTRGPGGDGLLRMVFSGESWVEVYDNEGNRLYYDMVKSGDEVSMQNSGLISVVIGNPQSAEVEYGGIAVELAPHQASGVARFTLGE